MVNSTYFLLTSHANDQIRRLASVETEGELVTAIEKAQADGYPMHLMDVDMFMQSGATPNRAQDFQWNQNAEEWYAKNANN